MVQKIYGGRNADSGQAVIVLVMIVAIVTLMFTHVALINISSLALSNEFYESAILRAKAEGYLESASIRYLRDVSYTGETLNDGDISCTMVVTDLGGYDRDLKSTCSRGVRSKTVGTIATYLLGTFEFSKVVEH